MKISKICDNGKTVLKPEGWLDTVSSSEFGAAIDEISKASEIVLDFELVEYISSAGLRTVVAAHKKAKSLEAGFSVINVGKEVMSIFTITGIEKKIDIKEKA